MHGSTEQDCATKETHADCSKTNLILIQNLIHLIMMHLYMIESTLLPICKGDPSNSASPIHGSTEQNCATKVKLAHCPKMNEVLKIEQCKDVLSSNDLILASLNSKISIDINDKNLLKRYVFYFSPHPSFYRFPIILTLIFCSDSPKRKVHRKYGPTHSTDDDSSDSGSDESSFLIPQSVEISSTGPAHSVISCCLKPSHIPTSPNKSFPKLVVKL